MSNSTQGLRAVGPGGPYEAMVECAEAFSRSRSGAVEVSKGPPERWLDRRADLIYGGFPQMLTAIAVTLWTPRRTLAREFISFLRSPRTHDVFRRRGWLYGSSVINVEGTSCYNFPGAET